ncbi:MAG: hypothetical protein WCP16_16800 [Pseudanabaena sp. ELA645]|jgi:hypothetical protein
MDEKLRDAFEQGQEQLRLGSKASTRTINAIISILANYAASNPQAKSLQERLEDLKNR